MIQALIATIVELVSLLFALTAGTLFEEAKDKSKSTKCTRKAIICTILSLLLAACALGIASR